MPLLLLLLFALAHADDGTVKLPWTHWQQMLLELDVSNDPAIAPVGVAQVDRSLEGSFRRGVFTGVLVARVRVAEGWDTARVPVLDAAASIASVSIDGKTTSLLADGQHYSVGVNGPGDHVVRVEFFLGREDDRFARRLAFGLPPSGPTRLSLFVPEADIEATLVGGAVTSRRSEAGGTRVEGQLDGRGVLDFTWTSRPTGHETPARVESTSNALFTLHESLVKGVLVVDSTVLEGETDRLTLKLAEGLEVVNVSGDAVLQWRADGGRLEVLLRYLVADRTSVRVDFQLPVASDGPIHLRVPIPDGQDKPTGALGVVGPVGLVARVVSATGTEPLRDLPPGLAALTPNPLLLGFTFTDDPDVAVELTKNADVVLVDTAVDEMEASTVVVEDGTEVTKAQFHVRNQTRQYLSVTLPPGAVLTAARIDGRPVRPAAAPAGDAILLPLVASETATGSTTWTVQADETLGDIADRFFGDPSKWGRILADNPGTLVDASQLYVGQVIRISGVAPVRRFVIDLAWTREVDPMGLFGSRSLTLPAVDADVSEVTWHVYLPTSVEPLRFTGNLTPYSHIRYDHFRRIRGFLDLVFDVRSAWASDEYFNILERRKTIYAAESRRSAEAVEATGSFPMVGERYRFERLFAGREVPQVSVLWVARDLLPGARLAGFLGAGALTLSFVAGDRRRRTAVAVGALGLLVAAWYVEGLHRRLLWGVDAGLLWVLLRSASGSLATWSSGLTWTGLLDRWTWGSVGRLARAAAVVLVLTWFPMAWSSVAFVVLAVAVRRGA